MPRLILGIKGRCKVVRNMVPICYFLVTSIVLFTKDFQVTTTTGPF